MESFLENVLDQLPDWSSGSEKISFILPSRRAGFFLRNQMARKAGKTILAPKIWSIEAFVGHISGIRYAPSLHALFRLYEAYLASEAQNKESFHDFAKWAPTLLQDFNETDRYLVDAEAMFDHLSALKEIRNWMPDGQTTDMIERQTAFWKSLWPLYTKFREILVKDGMGYQGQVYREALEALPEFLEENPGHSYVFIGFNALNAAENTLIRHILEAGRGLVFWDADSHYLDNPIHDAGHFLRNYRSKWNILNGKLNGTGNNLAQPKKIHLIGLPKSVAQARYCGKILEEIHRDNPSRLNSTAVVLGDETLLSPLLHSIPESIPSVNVTMGYPLKNCPLAQLFRILFQLWATRNPSGWSIHPTLELISNPFLQRWLIIKGVLAEKIRSRSIEENVFRADSPMLLRLGVPDAVIQVLFNTDSQRPSEFIVTSLNLILELKAVYKENDDREGLEYLRHFYTLFNQLEDLCKAHSYIASLQGLQLLFEQLLAEEQVDFQGEPLEGLQIMGMLESRNLDFETVILTHVNEGILPAGKSHSSFIPFEVKKTYGLPTYKEKDAIYTYHFYRLLQRARHIYICYNTEPDVLEGGEPSRFIEQLRTDPILSRYIEERTGVPEIYRKPEPPIEIQKSPSLIKRLENLGESGFSPTSLSRYIRDPLEFYTRNVLGIPESETLEENMAANTFGTVLHQALEDLYRPWESKILDTAGVREMIDYAPKYLQKAMSDHFLKDSVAQGKNLIALRVLEQQTQQFLEKELHLVKNHEVRILGVERRLKATMPIPGLNTPIVIKGTIDRIESVDGVMRIIDYKTGSVAPGDLRVDQWEGLSDDPKKSKAFQLLCYAWLYSRHQPVFPYRAGIISFRNLSQGRQWFGLRTGSRTPEEFLDEQRIHEFEQVLQGLILQIFSTDAVFSTTEP